MEYGKDSIDVLTDLLTDVRENVPYYSKIKESRLEFFPVVSKQDMKNCATDFMSKQYPNENKLHSVYTGGSSGVPFKALQDKNKRYRNIADIIYCHNKLGWKLGDKYIFIRGWSSNYKRSKLKNIAQNVIPIEARKFDKSEKEKLRAILKTQKNIILFGYASVFENFVNYIMDTHDSKEMFCVKLIVTDSDMLLPQTKNKLVEMFSCPVFNRYDNEEHGVLAYTTGNEDILTINRASYYLELLKLESDLPAKPGELGRIVVTDLYNRAMPFIRYDTGDLAISDEADRSNLTKLYSLEGRSADLIYDTHGNPVSSVTISGSLEILYNVKHYQLVQTKKNEYIFSVICDKEEYPSKIFIDKLKGCLRDNARIEVKYVEDIKKNENGKYRTTISAYNPN